MRAAKPLAALAAAEQQWPQGCLLVAVSGGLDSIALLHALAGNDAARARGLRALHVDHGLHPRSGEWADHVRRACAALDVPLQVQRVQVDGASGLGPEGAARAARHAAFADALPAGGILVAAHHADDQAETVLLRLLRASGADGLAGMRALRALGAGWLARPWLEVLRVEIANWAHSAGLQWIDDPSNAELHLARNRLRHAVMPILTAHWPHAVRNIARSAGLLAQSAARDARHIARDLAPRRGADPAVLDAQGLAALDEGDRGALLRHWLLDLRLPPPDSRALVQLARLLAAPRSDAVSVVRWPGAELRLWRGRLHAMAPLAAAPDLDHEWDGRHPLLLADGASLRIEGAIAPLALRVRSRRGGERMVLSPTRPPQSVKHSLQALGVPPWQRTRAPFVWHHDALWAVGDWLLASEFANVLATMGARLRYTPAPR
jgi:tRNA(Ile)-lysidine synthase